MPRMCRSLMSFVRCRTIIELLIPDLHQNPIVEPQQILGLPRVLEYSRVSSTCEYSTPKITRVMFYYSSTSTCQILLPLASFNFRFQFLQIKLLNCCHLCQFVLCDLFQLPTSLQHFYIACSLYWYYFAEIAVVRRS